MAVRINGLTTATSIEADDYVVIDGATSGTRKALVSDVGGENRMDFETTITPSIDARGVTASYYSIVPTTVADCTVENALKISAYLLSSTNTVDPLIVTAVTVYNSSFFIGVKSIYSSVQSTSTSSVSGTLHIVAPFEISSVTASM